MKTFRDHLKESSEISSLTIFDIDDTLFTTTTKIHIIFKGKTIHRLSPAEYNVYKLKDGETFDFSEFRSSKVFADTAKPIANVFKTAKAIINRFAEHKHKKIIVVTARADLDDRDLFLDTFKKYGFNTDGIRIERAGNLKKTAGAEAKKTIIRRYLKKRNYNLVRMFDDHHENLDKFLELKQEFPETSFQAFMIDKEGNIIRYGN